MKEEVTAAMKKATGELEKFDKQSASLRGSVKDLFRELAGPVATAGIAAGIGMIVKGSVEAASALGRVRNTAQQVFGEDFEQMSAGADRLAASMRRNASDILGFEANLTIAAESLGVTQDAAQKMSQSMARLAIDFGKAFGGSELEAMKTIELALEGNTRALRKYHIAVNDDILQSYAATQGIRAKVTEMDAEQKAILTYNFLLDKTQDIQAIANKNTGDFNDAVQDLSAAWDDLSETLGTPILPVIADTFSGIASIVRDVSSEVVALGNDIRWLFGLLGAGGGDGKVKGFGADQINAFWKKREGMGTLDLNATGLDFSLGGKPGTRKFEDFGVDLNKVKGGGGGGGGDKAGKEALSEAKDILSTIADIERDITDSLGKQADANRKMKDGLRDNLKLKKELGWATEDELRDLETLNRRLGDGSEKVDEMKEAFEKQKDVVKDLTEEVERLNQEMLDGAEDLKDALGKIDRDAGRSRTEKIADLIDEQEDLEGRLARGEGLSPEQQKRTAALKELLDRAKAENPGQFTEGKSLSEMDELQKIDREAEQKKQDLTLEYNEKLSDQTSKLTQANYDLAAAQGGLKAIQGDLVTAMGTYETSLRSVYESTEEVTRRHVAGQVAALEQETAAVNALAAAYAKVAALKAEKDGPSRPSVNTEDLARDLARRIQLQAQGSN